MRSPLREVYEAAAAPSEDAERRFFTRVRLPSGVYKTTESHRLDDVNRVATRLLPRDRPLELMDVATSSGITTLEWSEHLRAEGMAHHLVAGDSHVEGVWLSLGRSDILLDRGCRHVLFADILGRSVDVGGDSMRTTLVVGALRLLAQASPVLRLPVRRVQLVSPRVRDCATVTVVEDDIFALNQELTGRFDALRAANILNRHYFDDRRLRAAVANLRGRLRPDGLLIVCRTHADGTNHGTFFRLARSGWVVAARIGEGSEIEDLVVRDNARGALEA
jgi:SAM-dependent methyltransferase